MNTESGEKMDTETLNKSLENDKMETEAGTKSSDGDKMNTESGNKSLESDKMDTEAGTKSSGGDKVNTMLGNKSSDEGSSGIVKPSNRIFAKKEYDWKETVQPYVKITVIGEKGCGKSSLILAAKGEVFPHPGENFVPKQYPLDIEINGQKETCMVAEVRSGDEHFGSREKIYSETDVVLLCFREFNEYFQQVEKKWIQELKDHIPDVPVLLVKIRTGTEKERLSSVLEELEQYSGLLECCPHERDGGLEVFQEAFKKALGRKIREKK